MKYNNTFIIASRAYFQQMAIIGRRSQEAQHLREAGHYLTGTQSLKKNLPCNAEDNLRARLIVIEAWFRGY